MVAGERILRYTHAGDAAQRDREETPAMTGQRPQGTIHQINISPGGVPKLPVPEGAVTSEGIRGDWHNDTRDHGGPDRALCLFTLEEIQRLRAEGHPIFSGSTGENITLAGIPQAALVPGARLALGDEVVVEITRYTTPCKTITESFSDGDFTRISQKLHPGESRVYARVLREGTVRVGQPVRLLDTEE
jgi:MOSC domain-containing protein YiiM